MEYKISNALYIVTDEFLIQITMKCKKSIDIFENFNVQNIDLSMYSWKLQSIFCSLGDGHTNSDLNALRWSGFGKWLQRECATIPWVGLKNMAIQPLPVRTLPWGYLTVKNTIILLRARKLICQVVTFKSEINGVSNNFGEFFAQGQL